MGFISFGTHLYAFRQLYLSNPKDIWNQGVDFVSLNKLWTVAITKLISYLYPGRPYLTILAGAFSNLNDIQYTFTTRSKFPQCAFKKVKTFVRYTLHTT